MNADSQEIPGLNLLYPRIHNLIDNLVEILAVAKFRIKVVDSVDDIPEGDPSAEFMIYPEYEN